MINWDEVKVGETEIEKHDYPKRTILAIDGGWVWAKDYSGHMTIHKNELIGWTIYDPWEDVSEECSINEWGRVEHKGEIIDFKPNVYRRSEKGLRVWKRKEN